MKQVSKKQKPVQPIYKAFHVEITPEEWKYIETEAVVVRALTAEDAAEIAAERAGKLFRKQLRNLAKQKGRVCIAEVNVFNKADVDANNEHATSVIDTQYVNIV